MDASDPIGHQKTLVPRGPSTYGSRRSGRDDPVVRFAPNPSPAAPSVVAGAFLLRSPMVDWRPAPRVDTIRGAADQGDRSVSSSMETRMPEHINQGRRRFFGTAAMTVAAAQLGIVGSRSAIRKAGRCDQAGDQHVVRPAEADRAGCFNVGYAEAGPPTAPASFCCTAGLTTYRLRRCCAVAGAPGSGDRPYLRGYGTTRYSQRYVPQRPTVGARRRLIALMDALRVEKAVFAGFDWGARTADIVAALWPNASTRWSR